LRLPSYIGFSLKIRWCLTEEITPQRPAKYGFRGADRSDFRRKEITASDHIPGVGKMVTAGNAIMSDEEIKAEYLRLTKHIDASTDKGLAQIAAVLHALRTKSRPRG
jgi:hypothetical protein